VAGYARHSVVDSAQFANRATAALEDPAVRTLISARVADGVLRQEPDLTAVRPLLETVASSVVASGAFTGVFRSAVRDVHRALVDGDENTLTLTLRDIGVVLAGAVQAVRPDLADDLRTAKDVRLITRDAGPLSAEAIRAADRIRLLAWLFLVLALACAGGALALSRNRRATVVALGGAVAAAGLVLVVAYSIGRSVALGSVEGTQEREAVEAVFDAFLADLRDAAWVLAGCGAVVAAAAASLLRPLDVGALVRGAARAVSTEPTRPALRVLRGAALVATGVLLLVARDAVIALAFSLAGVLLIAAGTSAVLRMIYRPREAVPEAPRESRRRRPLIAGAVATLAIGGAVAVFAGSGAATTPAPRAGPCNGHRALCGRPLPDVALPATHNSMSAPLPGWYAALVDGPIAEQLADGIRGLLIDSHYADKLANGRLRTDATRIELIDRAKEDGVSPQAIEAALRLRDRAGFAGEGERGMYLCHTFCELGGTELGSVLTDLHDFLAANPGEVVVVINQDYVTPEDFVGAVRDAGLERYAFTPPPAGRPWPTLRQMIDSGHRVLFLAENRGGAAPWYQRAYDELLQETPFSFRSPAPLLDPANLPATCADNRGPASAPLFLVNHWVTTDPLPRPSDADAVNAYEPLLARLRTCERVRRHIPNLVAVNFPRHGDLYRAVDTINGVR
jgi:hypothetical protein